MSREQVLSEVMRESQLKREYSEEYESQQNGNISRFKEWLGNLSGEEIYNFIKWLQAEGLEI